MLNKATSTQKGRSKLSLAVLAVSLLILLVALGLWWHHAYQNRWGKITFQEYVPTYLPDRLAITQKSVDASYVPSNSPSHTTELHLQLSKKSLVYEMSASAKSFRYDCGFKADNQTCEVSRATSGQQFVLTTTTIPGQPMEQNIEWVKGDTYILINLIGEHSQPYTQQEISKIVDSFTPATYKNLPVNYYDHSKI